MEGSIKLCETLLNSLEKLATKTDNLSKAQKIRLLLPAKKSTVPLIQLKPDLEALCLKFYTLDSLEQQCLASLMQILDATPVGRTTRKRKIQAIQRFQDEDYEEYDSDDDIDLYDDEDANDPDLQEFEDCKMFLDWKEINTLNVQEHWWFKHRYGVILNAIQQQMGHEGRNENAKNAWGIVIHTCLAGKAYSKIVTTCIFCDTKHACSKALVINDKRESIGSHCARLASTLIEFFTIVRKGTLENARQTFKDMERAFADVQSAHASKSGN